MIFMLSRLCTLNQFGSVYTVTFLSPSAYLIPRSLALSSRLKYLNAAGHCLWSVVLARADVWISLASEMNAKNVAGGYGQMLSSGFLLVVKPQSIRTENFRGVKVAGTLQSNAAILDSTELSSGDYREYL